MLTGLGVIQNDVRVTLTVVSDGRNAAESKLWRERERGGRGSKEEGKRKEGERGEEGMRESLHCGTPAIFWGRRGSYTETQGSLTV